MSIWEYSPTRTLHTDLVSSLRDDYCRDDPESDYYVHLAANADRRCRYCRAVMTVLAENSFESCVYIERFRHLYACPRCGWWFYVDMERTHSLGREHHVWVDPDYAAYPFNVRCCESSIRELDLTNIDQPLDDVARYLCAKADARYSLHPRLFEEVVGSVFRNIGYDVVVTSYGNDGGVDAILTDSNGIIGVQVKRYQTTIKVAQIRELLGALVLLGSTRGVFVTTSDFQKGAYRLQSDARQTGFDLYLMNGERFLDALGVTQRAPYEKLTQFDVDYYNRMQVSTIGNFAALGVIPM